MPKGFISLGRGCSINVKLVKNVAESNGRYYVNDVYGMGFCVDAAHYKKAKKVLEENW